MFFFNPEKVSEFLNNIARGFERRPIDLVMFGVVILLIIGFLLTAYLLQRSKARQLAARLGRERYDRLARKLGLTPAEEELVGRLASGRAAAKVPGAKAKLLLSAAAFSRAAGRLPGGQPEQLAGQLAELRLKLGFQAGNPERVPSASSELPAGLPVLVVQAAAGGSRRFGARVQDQQPQALVLRVEASQRLPPAGQQVTVVFQNRAGLFSFTTVVRSSGQGLLHLAHSEKLRRTQRRKYYRRRVQLAVQVRRFAREEDPPQSSVLLDLGGAGASLQNPGKRFGPGDELELRFRLSGEAFDLAGEVLRVSRDGQVLHLRFLSLSEAVRDRLIGVLFQNLGAAAR